MRLFELDWQGGTAERYFRRARPGIDELPWGTLSPAGYSPELVEAAAAHADGKGIGRRGAGHQQRAGEKHRYQRHPAHPGLLVP